MTTAKEAIHRYVIIGAGPGGLQLSYFLQRAGADYLTLERENVPGCFFRRFPRHRKLISLNKVHSPSDDQEIRRLIHKPPEKSGRVSLTVRWSEASSQLLHNL